ncbi:Rtf2 RING-finger-domain-containing protein [Xylaria sp. CBS 124048]|nr:Rtf2 RING-finger-domain-containing protein [Xylaria sp. CBS 124048]
MGNDGGSIPKRRELVKEAARLPTASELKATALESLTHAWSTCPISSEPLDPDNTVSDWRGRLYNYETVLRCLMPGADANEFEEDMPSQEAAEFARSGIHSIKDIIKLRFTMRKSEPRGAIRTCPLSMKELGPATRSVYVVPCGHVFAEIAMKELLAASEDSRNAGAASTEAKKTRSCPECSEAFEDRDIVPVLPVEESDVDKCAARIEDLQSQGLAHSLKKDKNAGGKNKKKKRKAAEEEDDGKLQESGALKEKKQKKDRDDISSRINNSMTATLTAKVLAEQEKLNKQRKLAAAVR